MRDLIIYADFETIVNDDTRSQKVTDVWSAAFITSWDTNEASNVIVLTSLQQFMKMLNNLTIDSIVYFHNLKFDGSFILTYLERSPKWTDDTTGDLRDLFPAKIKPYHFRYMISSMNQWYSITLKNKSNHLIEIRDSLKLAPQSLEKLGKAFKTKHQKLEMKYTGEHKPNGVIKPEELKYIQNDVLVLKEVMEALTKNDVTGLTIGSACIHRFHEDFTKKEWDELFPDLTQIELPCGVTAYNWIRKSYHGGFCYVAPQYQGKELNFVSHCDANSHYPSMMHSQSGNYYPIGKPHYISDTIEFNEIEHVPTSKKYYFVHFTCSFDIKPKKIPMIQIKHNIHFRGTEWLTSSNNQEVEITMTCTDYLQFLDSYNISNYNFIDCVWFETKIGLFDKYIDYWYKIKENATGAIRQIAKLYLNNLYGKFATSPNSNYKIAKYVEGEGLKYQIVDDNSKKTLSIAIGSAITSYARHKTEMIAQDNFDNFVYADTDSCVMTVPENEIKGLPVHPTKLCYWKVESNSDRAKFLRQKTYMEHVIAEDGKAVEKPYINLKCVGLTADAGNKWVESFNGDLDGLFSAFKPGLEIGGNLKSVNIDGGVLLREGEFNLH